MAKLGRGREGEVNSLGWEGGFQTLEELQFGLCF